MLIRTSRIFAKISIWLLFTAMSSPRLYICAPSLTNRVHLVHSVRCDTGQR